MRAGREDRAPTRAPKRFDKLSVGALINGDHDEAHTDRDHQRDFVTIEIHSAQQPPAPPSGRADCPCRSQRRSQVGVGYRSL